MVDQRVLGILAGQDFPKEALLAWLDSAEVVVAADGAANALVRLDRVPDFVVGDLDSLDDVARTRAPKIVEDPDQETTDVDKLLKFVVEQGGRAITLAGLEGDRFDHMLAAAHSALQTPLHVRLVLRQGFAYVVHAGDEYAIESYPGQGVSFIPMVDAHGVVMEGVKWAPQSTLSPRGATSISNEATGDVVSIKLEEGSGLLFANRDTRIPIW